MTEYAYDQCPVRGPALTHMGSYRGASSCTFCAAPLHWQSLPPRGHAPLDGFPVIDVVARLAMITGKPVKQEPAVSEPVEDDPYYDENAPREPKMARGEPEGPEYGRGRSWRGDGALNPRDLPRLEDILHRQRKDGYK